MKELELKLQNYIATLGENNIVLNNIEFFYIISNAFSNKMKTMFQFIRPTLDFKKMTKITLEEKIRIIKEFYKSINVDINIDELISNGTIDLIFNDSYDNNEGSLNRIQKLFLGWNSYDSGHRSINAYDNGVVSDILILVHEISHFRNQPNYGRTQISSLFTETLAFLDQLICSKYLCDLGYDEIKEYLKVNLLNLYRSVERQKSLSSMIMTYMQYGDITEENYNKSFNNYENDLLYLQKNINNLDLLNNTYYALAIALIPNLYIDYQNNGYKNIEKLYELINQNDILKIFSAMGLKQMDNNDLNKMTDALQNVVDNFSNSKQL